MGLFVVGRLAARHGVRVRLRHAQTGGLTALIWLPDTVAAPEVAPPLGRLRRFEADDYGPVPSLSAPTQSAAGASPQATAAARIPRFSPTSPASTPSFTPAAGPPDAFGPAGPTIPVMPAADAAGQAAGNGWESGEETKRLPVRNTNGRANGNGNGGAAPANGSAADAAGAADPAPPRTPGAPAAQAGPPAGAPGSVPGGVPGGPGPSRLPSFGGLSPQVQPIPQSPIGSQNVHGGDGPGAADPATVANRGGNGHGSQPADGAADPGQVTVPPPSAANQRLPIFDSLESDWFRRSGRTLSPAHPAGTPAAPGGPAPGSQAQPAAEPAWKSPADEGWRAAAVVASPTAGDTTQAGLPKRVPRANLVPGSVGDGGESEAQAPARSADAVRSRMASFQRGVREGRAAAPQTEEPQER